MRTRFAGFAVLGAVTLAGAGALAQAEAERRLDAAIERLRGALGPDTQITFARRQIDPVTGRATLGGILLADPTRRLSIEEAVLSAVTETRIGRAELRALRLEEGKDGQTTLGRLVIGGLTLPPLGQGFEIEKAEIGLLELDGLQGTRQREGSMRIGRLAIEGYAPGVLGSARIEGVQYDGTGPDAARFSLGRLAVGGLVMPLPGAALEPGSVRISELAVEGLALREPDSKVELTLGRVALRDFVPGRAVSFSLEGLQLAASFGALGAGTARLGRASLTGLDAAGTLAAVLEGVQVPDPMPGVPQALLFEGFTLETAGQPLLAVGRLTSDTAMDAAGVLTGGGVLEGLSVTPPRGSAAWLEELGYRSIRGRIESRGMARREGGPLTIDPLAIQWEQAGTLRLTARAEGLPGSQAGQRLEPADYLARLAAGRLVGLTLRWEEDGLLGRVVAQQARAQRMPEARLREQWAQMALSMPLQGAAPPPGRGRAATPQPGDAADPFGPMRTAIADFIRNPRAIELTLSPPAPIAFDAMQALANAGPAEAARRFGLSVRVP
jgi:hypothetical protein